MTPEEAKAYRLLVQRYAKLIGFVVAVLFCLVPWLVAKVLGLPVTDLLLTVVIYLLFMLGTRRGR